LFDVDAHHKTCPLGQDKDSPDDGGVFLLKQIRWNPITKRKKEIMNEQPSVNNTQQVLAISARPESKQDALTEGSDAFISKIDHPSKCWKAFKR
jgi:hypothetical protein